MAEYKVFKQGKEMPSDGMDREAMLERADRYLKRGEEAKVWYKHRDPQKKFHPIEASLQRVKNLTRLGDTGSRVILQVKGMEDTLVIVKVEKSVSVPDLGAHPEIEKAHALLWDKYGEDKLRSGGLWFCRFVSGTKVVSKHGYLSEFWKGAAEDVFGEGSANNMTALYDMQKFLVTQHNQGKVKLATVIAGDKIWEAGKGYSHYSGVFHTHIHMDADGGQACKP